MSKLDSTMADFEKWFAGGARNLWLAESTLETSNETQRAMAEVVLDRLADAVTAWRVFQNLSADDSGIRQMAENMAAEYKAESANSNSNRGFA